MFRNLFKIVIGTLLLCALASAGINSNQHNGASVTAFGSDVISSQSNFVYAYGGNINNLQCNALDITAISSDVKAMQSNEAWLIEAGTDSSSSTASEARGVGGSGAGDRLRKIKITKTLIVSGDDYTELTNVGDVAVNLNQWFTEIQDDSTTTVVLSAQILEPGSKTLVKSMFIENQVLVLYEPDAKAHDRKVVEL